MKTIKNKRKEPTKVLTDKKKLAAPSTKGKIPFLKRCVGLYMDIRDTFFITNKRNGLLFNAYLSF